MNIYHRLDSVPFNQVQNSEQYSYPYGKQEVFVLFRGASGGWRGICSATHPQYLLPSPHLQRLPYEEELALDVDT